MTRVSNLQRGFKLFIFPENEIFLSHSGLPANAEPPLDLPLTVL